MNRERRGDDATAKAPVLVLGWIPRIVLTVARSLHKHGIPVDVADCVLGPPVRSRAVRRFLRLPYPNNAPFEFLRALRSTIAEGGHDLLIPTDDLAIAAIMEHYDELKHLIRIACPPPDITRAVLNKLLTLEVARRCGIRVPRTVTVDNSAKLFEVAKEIPLPWILKPAEKEKRFEEFTSCRFGTIDEVKSKYPEALAFVPPMLVQEYCEGVGVGIEAILHEGQCLLTFQHRRLKELPYGGGVAVTAIAEKPDPALVESSLRLLKELRWDGVAMVEFRVNQSTGDAVLMEVNGRFWGTVSLPVSAGLDFPFYQWQLAHGQYPSIPAVDAAGKRWRWTVGYFNRLYRLFVFARRSQAARAELKRTLSEVFSDFSSSTVDALSDSSDPMPAIREFMETAKFFSGYSVAAIRKRMPRRFSEPPAHTVTRP